MSFEAESNSELTVIVPAYYLHFRFPLQNKIHKQKILSDTRTGILGSIAGPCDFLPARSDGPTNFKKSDQTQTNERFTRMIRKTHDSRNGYMKRIHERNETNELCGKHKRTNARYTNERIIGA